MSQVCGLRGGPAVEPERLGSHRLGFAFERFEEYWHTGRMDLTENVQAMHEVLRSSAREYERRDAEDAEGFDRGALAI